MSSSSNKMEEQSWEWGKLPTTSSLKEVKEPTEKIEASGTIAQRHEAVQGPKGGMELQKPEGKINLYFFYIFYALALKLM